MASVLAQVSLLHVSVVHQPLDSPNLLFFSSFLQHNGCIEKKSTELTFLNGTHTR